MKSLDEIKKGLECCTSRDCGGSKCPYFNEKSCNAAKSADALALIKQLEARAHQLDLLNIGLLVEKAQLEAERDAAVKDMREAQVCLCLICKNHKRDHDKKKFICKAFGDFPFEDGPMICGQFEWRGLQKEE